MKTKRFMVAFAIAFAVILCGFFAFAAEPAVAVSSTPFETHQGETFTTTVCIPDNGNIVDFDVTLEYDTDLLTLVSAEENSAMRGTVIFNTETPGTVRINYTRTSENVNTKMPLVDLTFTVDENIGVGTYDCLSVKKGATYIAHRLKSDSTLEKVDFACDFAKLVIYEMGDVDLSTSVDIGDVTYLRRHLAEIEGAALTPFKLTLADTYYDNSVDIADAVCLQRHLAELKTTYGNRVNIVFYDADGNKYATKSVLFGESLTNIPAAPAKEGYIGPCWSASQTEYEEPSFENLEKDCRVYAFYSGNAESDAIAYYKTMLTDMYHSGDLATNLSSDLKLKEELYYQKGYHAALVWNSTNNYVLNSTTGTFTKPTYPQDMVLTARIISYDGNDIIEGESEISFAYAVPGVYICPTKNEVADFLNHYFTDDTDGKYRINYDLKLVTKVNNTVLPTEGNLYDNFEIRLAWYQVVEGEEVPISQIKRTTTTQSNDYAAVATFNGKPLCNENEKDGDGKIYFDDVEVTSIDQMEIRDYIIGQIAAKQGTLATNGTNLWNSDEKYGSTVTWKVGEGASKIAYIANNKVELKEDAVSGSVLPLNAVVSYATDKGADTFTLAYNLTVSCDNTKIKSGTNMDAELYRALKAELNETLGYSGDLTSAALADVRFVNLDLSGYPEITSLNGLSYCTNLRTLNISGLHITDSTMNQIATLSYLEAFIARGCGLDSLTDGGTATLKNAVNLKLIDLTDNNFTSLDSVFAEGVRYGKLREVYLAGNRLTDISALSRAPIMTYLSLADNGLTTDAIACITNYPALQYLSLAYNNIDNVDVLSSLKSLRELRLHNNKISNVDLLRKLVNLEILYIGHNQIKNIGYLNTLTKLQVLYANDNQISDVSALTALTELEAFNISDNQIAGLSVLRNWSKLTEIYAENNQLTDFSFINGKTGLRFLMLAGNKTELAQTNMTSWLSAMSDMQVLTLSEIKLNDLSFLSAMTKLVRLDVDGCGLTALNGEDSNLGYIGERYATLRVLNISNNDFCGYESDVLALKDCSLLTILYADNICNGLNAYELTYSMPELKFISLEDNGIASMSWLSKQHNIVYVDLADNHINDVDFENFLSDAGRKSVEELYLDTDVDCTFTNAFNISDFQVKALSLQGVSVGRMERMPLMDNIEYLNLANTDLPNLTGDDAGMEDVYGIIRYQTLKTVDVSGLEAEIAPLENLAKLQTVYAVGVAENKVFYQSNLHALQRLYNKGVTCYLYDTNTVYEPVAETEGGEILALLPDYSCTVTVAADNVFSDNNPTLASRINDYDITWSVSNGTNYEIKNNKLSVKDYTYLEDETLTITASIQVYPDQAPVSRSFTYNTKVLRATADYLDVNANGYSESLTRDSAFTYGVTLKAAETQGFANAVKPVEDYIRYSYSAKTASGDTVPYLNVLDVDSAPNFTVTSNAPLGATATVNIEIGHQKDSETTVNDMTKLSVPVTVVSRTFTATFVMNGGTLKDGNGVSRSQCDYVEDSQLFANLTYSRAGYNFAGWYLDENFGELFSLTGAEATMPSRNITLYAKWDALQYNLLFNANGGSVSTSSKTVLSDVAIGTLPTPTRQYYTFNGWYTAASGGTKVTENTSFARTSDLTLYAQWTLNSFVVTFNANGGSVGTSTLRAYCGQKLGSLPTPSRDYYTFNGWYTASSGGTKVTADTVYTVANNITVYAQWTVKSYSVSWNTGTGYTISVNRTSSPNKGASTGSIGNGATVYYGDTLTVTYKASTGYSISSHGTTSITVTGNVTSSNIYATASINSYTYNIVYISSNGTALGSSSATYNYGTTNTIYPPAKSGYDTPAAQSVVWDSTSAKTITFVYTPSSVATRQVIATGNWWTSSSGYTSIDYVVEAEWRNRTADSVEIRIIWTNTITNQYNSGYYGYKQEFEWWGWHQIASASDFASKGGTRSASNVSGWHTYSCTADDISQNTGSEWRDGNGHSGNWNGTIYFPKY